MKKYLPFLKFIFSHDYFSDGKFHNASLLFYEGKKKAERNYKLLLQEEAAGTFVIYIESGDNFEDRLRFFINDLSENQLISLLFGTDNEHLQALTKNIDIKANNQLFKLALPIGNDKVQNFQLSDFEKTSGNTVFEKQIQIKRPKALLYITFNTENSDIDSLRYQIENEDPLTINIRFEAKSAIWKYIFLPRNKQLSDLSIIDSKQLIKFSKINWNENINNQQAGVAYSEEEITFSEKYPFNFQLWKNYFNGRSLIVHQLPFPDPCHTGNFYRNNENNYISIYQYF